MLSKAVQLDKEIIELQRKLDRERDPLSRKVLLGNILRKEMEQYNMLKRWYDDNSRASEKSRSRTNPLPRH